MTALFETGVQAGRIRAERNPSISSNGRWMAYNSNESGRNEIYVRPFPNIDDGLWLVSTGGGIAPVWSQRGDELFYQAVEDRLARFDVAADMTRISDIAVVPYRQDQAPRLDFWGSAVRNDTREGDTLWVNYTWSHFSSRSTVS